MRHSGRVVTARVPDVGRIGLWTGALGLVPAALAREALPEIEELGYRAVWFPEGVDTKESFSQAAMLLAWSERIVIATGIAGVLARDAVAMANAARGLDEAYPGRLLVGIGTNNVQTAKARGHEFGRPLAGLSAYLDAMDAAPYAGPRLEVDPPRVLAALGPRMLALAAERAAGAHTSVMPPDHTSGAREILGDGPLLAVKVAVVLETDRAKAHAIGHQHLAFYLERKPYRDTFLRLGFSEADLAGDGSDRLVDAVVAWGTVETVMERIDEHFEAGADHVCVHPLGGHAASLGLGDLRELAPALAELAGKRG